ncbi:FAD-dependent monooxygenase [Actinoallomurus sp. NPDC052274]|uniref:FAD-dependent monooxygenase n=1 Tax=Actinoallomurus sp. NPDC052274 TaxID=3155420 RepID=UPI00341AC1D6
MLIVGAGYAGLSAAVSLAWRGIPPLLVERHPGTSVRPKAYGLNHRAMELLRQAPGLEEALRTEALTFHRLVERSFAGCVPPIPLPEPGRPSGLIERLTPVADLGLYQDHVEGILRAKAEDLGANLRFATELTSLRQDPDGVTATVEAATGVRRTIRAEYLIAADGHDSPVRTALRTPTRGMGELARTHLVAFRAGLSGAAPNVDLELYHLLHRDPMVAVAFGSTRADTDTHLLRLTCPPNREAVRAGLRPERCAELIRSATGLPGLDVEVLDQSAFSVGHLLAERFSTGRVFLAGDAAHVMPPSGGQASSAAVHDGWDIGWRLALVLTGQAGPDLLDTYDAERRPVCHLIADFQLANWFARTPGTVPPAEPTEPVDPARLTFGHRYRSGAVIQDEGADEDGPVTEDPFAQTGRPGGRAPHVILERGGEPLSTLDLFGPDLVLLAGPSGADWADAARDAAARLGVRLTVHRIGTDLSDPTGTWCARYGVGPAGASLVRPDGHVAWRSRGRADDAPRVLREALARILARVA